MLPTMLLHKQLLQRLQKEALILQEVTTQAKKRRKMIKIQLHHLQQIQPLELHLPPLHLLKEIRKETPMVMQRRKRRRRTRKRNEILRTSLEFV